MSSGVKNASLMEGDQHKMPFETNVLAQTRVVLLAAFYIRISGSGRRKKPKSNVMRGQDGR